MKIRRLSVNKFPNLDKTGQNFIDNYIRACGTRDKRMHNTWADPEVGQGVWTLRKTPS